MGRKFRARYSAAMLRRVTTLLLVLATSPMARAQAIEPLTPPKPAVPPRPDGGGDEDLERKRRERGRREPAPVPEPASQVRDRSLLKETLATEPPALLIELSLLVGTVANHGPKEGYTMDPTTHFNVYWRKRPKAREDKIQLFAGGRVAPFAGTGFYEERPGSYGITYFGPMVGVGRIGLVPQDTARDPDAAIPSANGWLVSVGLMAATTAGKRPEGEPGKPGDGGRDDDFKDRKVIYDAPGLALEARYLRLSFGRLGFDAVFGLQAGRNRQFFYAGLGVAGYY